ncbi:Chromate resistance protein ChrB [Streptomyces sp. CG1]|uniref:Chromate resistance protein ChrB n=1 Tax=Streptomyces sp. CG1 TaxID=1287523 RepID=UPI0034E25FF4
MIKVPAEPSRHRVAVWQELRRIGALSLGQGVWAVPDVPVTLPAAGPGPEDAARFQAPFTAARSEDWAEFLADCGKFTLAELEEEEHSLERLRRWHRDLTARDAFAALHRTPEDEQ